MQQFMQFVINHWILVSVFVVLLIALFVEEARGQGMMSGLSPSELTLAINKEDAVVIDIRETPAFQKGHIAGAVNLPSSMLEQSKNKLTKYKDKPVVVVCQSGKSCVAVSASLRKEGFTKATILKGGINAWQSANLPLVADGKD